VNGVSSIRPEIALNGLANGLKSNGIHEHHEHTNGVDHKQANGHKHATVDPRNYDDIIRLAEVIRDMVDLKESPTIGVICGSGLGDLAELLVDKQVVPYTKIPGFPQTSVVGHKGNLVFGYLSGKYVMCLQGRFHPYEHDMDLVLCTMPVRIMHHLGVKTMIVSNAAGGINHKFNYGDLMIIKDHVFMPGLVGFSPLVGLNDPRFGARFVSVHDAYDKQLRNMARRIAEEEDIRAHEGIYVMSGGPQYESPAEVKLYKVLGADALGMSTCHEVTVARQCGIRVFGFSLITNIGNDDADTSVEVSHEEVLQTAKEASVRACRFVSRIIDSL
jgi:purine-nucleoside phosphorylase